VLAGDRVAMIVDVTADAGPRAGSHCRHDGSCMIIAPAFDVVVDGQRVARNATTRTVTATDNLTRQPIAGTRQGASRTISCKVVGPQETQCHAGFVHHLWPGLHDFRVCLGPVPGHKGGLAFAELNGQTPIPGRVYTLEGVCFALLAGLMRLFVWLGETLGWLPGRRVNLADRARCKTGAG